MQVYVSAHKKRDALMQLCQLHSLVICKHTCDGRATHFAAHDGCAHAKAFNETRTDLQN